MAEVPQAAPEGATSTVIAGAPHPTPVYASGYRATGKWLFHEFLPYVGFQYIAQLLIGLNGKCPKSDGGEC